MSGSNYLTYPKFLPPILKFFLSKLNIRTNDMYQNDHLKWKSKFPCIQSLVLEIKGLKEGYIFKNSPIYISFVVIHFQADLNIPRKKV